ncbi:hypothetical protein ABK040_006665 [Willaertia magna]
MDIQEASSVLDSVSDHNRKVVETYLQFTHKRTDLHLKEISKVIQNVKDSRLLLNNQYSLSEVQSIIESLETVVKATVKSETVFANHTSLELLRQVFLSADNHGFKMEVDISSIENEEILQEISKLENSMFNSKITANKLPSLKPTGEDSLKLKRDNENLKDKLTSLNKTYMEMMKEKTEINTELMKAKDMIKCLEDKIENLSKQEPVLIKEPSEPVVVVDNEKIEKLEKENDTLSEEIKRLNAELQRTEKELNSKVNQTSQFQNLMSIVKTKNEELKELREKLANCYDILLSHLLISLGINYSEPNISDQVERIVKEYTEILLRGEEITEKPRVDKSDWSEGESENILKNNLKLIAEQILKELGSKPKKSVEEVISLVTSKVKKEYSLRTICNKIRDIKFTKSKISSVDPKFVALVENLECLGLSANRIVKIDSLPRNIFSLNAFSNNIEKVCNLKNFSNLLHLGLGGNQISNLNFLEGCTALMSVDLSFNNLLNMQDVLTSLSTLPSLKMLNLQGNCFTLLECYRGAVFSTIPGLETLDEVAYNEDSKKPYLELFKGFEQSNEVIKLTLNISTFAGINFDEEIKLISEKSDSASVDTGRKSAASKRPLLKKPTEKKTNKKPASKENIVFIKVITYHIQFEWINENNESVMKETKHYYLSDPDPKANTNIVNVDFNESIIIESKPSVSVRHLLEKPVSFYIQRVVAEVQEDDESNRKEISKDLIAVVHGNFNSFLKQGFILPKSLNEGEEPPSDLRGLLKNKMDLECNLIDIKSGKKIPGQTLGLSLQLHSSIWDSFEQELKEPKKRNTKTPAKTTKKK